MSAVVAESGVDAGVAWHFGDPMREQRLLEQGAGLVDLSHRDVLSVSGPDRLAWLHSLTTQQLEGLPAGVGVTALILSPQGHIEHALYGVDDGETFWAHTEPGAAAAAVTWLERMRFLMRVEVADRSDVLAVVWTASPDAPDQSLNSRAGLDSLGGREVSCRATSSRAFSIMGRGREPGRTRRAGSRRAYRGSAWTPTIARSRTRSACSVLPCISTKAATGARRR
jgi:folate-binding Fe-S cluster repair protein YgfZ